MNTLRWLCRVPPSLFLLLFVVLGCGESRPRPGEQEVSSAVSALTANAVALELTLPTSQTAGTPATVTVRAVDGSGNTETAYTGTVHWTAGAPSTQLPPDTTFQPEDAGLRVFQLTPFTAGTQTLAATDTSLSSLTGSASLVVLAAAPASYQISNLPAAPKAGVATSFDVTALDAYGNVATGYAGTGKVTSSDLAALLPPNRSFAAGLAAGVPITFVRSGAQTVTIEDTADPALRGTAATTVGASTSTSISAPANVTTGATGLAASTSNWSGATYTWSILGGSITAGQGTRSITFSAGPAGTLTLGVVALRSGSVRVGSRDVGVVPAPLTPTITSANAVNPSSTGNVATVFANPSMKYAWTATGATLTSSSAGVTSNGLNRITFTAKTASPITLSVVEKNLAGAVSAPGTATIAVFAGAPKTPAITATSPVTAGNPGRTASVPLRTGFSYAWTIAGGTITSAGGGAGVPTGTKNVVTYTPGAAGTLTLTCTETVGSYYGMPGSKAVTVIAAPTTPVISASSPVPPFTPGLTASVVAQTGMTYSWSIVGGTLTSPSTGDTAGGLNTVTYTSGGPGPLTLSAVELNALGDAGTPGTASVTVSLPLTPPLTPTISAPASMLTGASATASVVARSNLLYAWTISGGTLTSAGGASGVTVNGVNSVTFVAGAPGSLELSCVEQTGLGTSDPGLATVTVTAPPPPAGSLYFVAHQDDDLLFMNPDIERSIHSGQPTRTVFVTAGDDGSCTPCWQGRENGIWNAYAAMANVAKDWTCSPTAYGGKTVSQCVLNTAPHVSVVFLRLPDGGLSSLWATDGGPPFYVTPVDTLASVDGAYSVTRAEAITLLHDLLVAFNPAEVGALDGTLAYGDDHPDHVVAGLFALEATLRAPVPPPFRFYRAYNIYGTWFSIPSPEPENLSLAEYAEKVRVMEAYGGAFPVDGDFDRWCHRQYSVSRVLSGNGPLVEPGGSCLGTPNGATASGSPVEVHPCDGGETQQWTLAVDGSLLGAAGRCLAADPAGAVVLADCDGSLSQRFALFANGQLRTAGGACLTVGWDGSSVSAASCDPDRSTDKYVPLPTQRFTQVFGPLDRWSQGTEFSDADVGGAASYYGTLALGRSDPGALLDACVRRASGVACASNTNPDFGPLEAAGPFDDGTGWLPAEYGATVQLADVDGDGLADACGRSATGIVCALRGPTGGFGAVLPWTSDFGDATFGGAAYSPSVRFGDLDGDGFADVCGRAADGLQCAKNTHVGSFAPATPWLPGEFTDAGGWDAAASTGTLQLGDLTGDGRADVCLRGAAGVRCAVSNGDAFVDPHLWSFRAEWSDAEGWSVDAGRYGSLRMGDVNGDGLADLCGRAATGLVCALSTGSAFEGAAPLLTQGFTDVLGWAPEAYGSTLRLGDLNGDTRADVCGRASDGLVCALSP